MTDLIKPFVVPVPLTSLAGAVNAAQAEIVKLPAGLEVFNSNNLGVQYFHGCIYGETDARKTTTAAQFSTPEKTLIVLTRRKEQVKPLEGLGYTVAMVKTAEALNYALQFPEKISPSWAKHEDRVLILDDATEAATILTDYYTTTVGDAFGRNVREAGNVLRDHTRTNMRKPQHFIMTALAKASTNRVTKEERVALDLPPSLIEMMGTELEYAFYIRKGRWKLLTETDTMSYEEYDPDQKKVVSLTREIFAKNKLPLSVAMRQPRILFKEEPMNLRAIWDKIAASGGAK